MIFASPILVWVSYLIMNIIVVFRMEFLYDVTYLVLPSKYMLVGIATLIGTLISTLIITAFINNTILADWEDYLYYVNNQFRFNVVTGYYYFKRISFFVIIVLLYLTIDWFSAFGNEEIKINAFWGVGTAKYPYKHVTQILQIYNPNQDIETTSYKIHFKDGSVWNSNLQGFSKYKQNKQLIWHVSNQSSMPIKDVIDE